MRRYRMALLALAMAASAGALIALVVHARPSAGAARAILPARAPQLPSEIMVPPRETIASLRGKPAVINFWASWCESCRDEAAGLEQLATSLHGRVTLVGID